MPVIEITNLTKDYEIGFFRKRTVRALDGLSLSIDHGQIFGFLGANGAGKTTTLKLLMRLIFPTTGSARILGHDIQDVSMHQRIGYLPENPYFYDYLTAREFLDYCGEIFGLRAAQRKKRTADLLARVKLDEKRWKSWKSTTTSATTCSCPSSASTRTIAVAISPEPPISTKPKS